MRSFCLFLSLLCILTLTACGSEEELNPPVFSNVKVNDADVSSIPYMDSSVTITGNIDDFAATIVANTTASGEDAVAVAIDGRWIFEFTPLVAGLNFVNFTASDKRGNFNQMILTILHDPTPPSVIAVTQSVADPENPQLIVTFGEAILASSLTSALFTVNGSSVTSVDLDPLANNIVTLTLNPVLVAGSYTLTYSGISDPAGNMVSAANFDFTIAE